MYTGLRIKVTIKEEYREMIQAINEEKMYFRDYVEQYPFLSDFANLQRSDSIPSGISAYMPTSWEDTNEKATDGFERYFDMNTGIWVFQCSLKNYGGVIERFFADVLPHIIISAEHIESWHEEDAASVMYHYKEGKIVKDD